MPVSSLRHSALTATGSLKLLLFRQRTAYEVRISDWSSDVCSSDLLGLPPGVDDGHAALADGLMIPAPRRGIDRLADARQDERRAGEEWGSPWRCRWSPYH